MKKASERRKQCVQFDVLPKLTSKTRSTQCTKLSSGTEHSVKSSKVKFKECPNVKYSKSVQFVRNTEQPIRKTASSVNFFADVKSHSLDQSEVNPQSTDGLSNRSECLELAKPELCTSLKVANQILEEASSGRVLNKEKSSGIETISSKSKAPRKVNIPFEEQVYKDLVALKVTEDDLFSAQHKKIKSKHFERIKDKEPELSDFYRPSFSQEYILKTEPVHCEADKIIHFNGFYVSDKIKMWKIAN